MRILWQDQKRKEYLERILKLVLCGRQSIRQRVDKEINRL